MSQGLLVRSNEVLISQFSLLKVLPNWKTFVTSFLCKWQLLELVFVVVALYLA